MGYQFYSFPSPSLFPLRGHPGGDDDPKDKEPGPNMRNFWIFMMFVVVAVVTMLVAEKIRVNLTKTYHEQQRIHQTDTSKQRELR
jgi:hypothetical protein